MNTYTIKGNTKIVSKSDIVYRTLTIPATTNQTYTLTLTKGSYGTLPSYTSTATRAEQTLRVPFGTSYSISYSADTGYNAGATKSDTVGVNNIDVTHNDATLKYFTLSVGAATNQTYAISGTADATYGGTIPSATNQSAAGSWSFPYGSTATITYTSNDNDVWSAFSTVTKTMTSDQSVDAASASVRYWTVTFPATTNQTYTVAFTKESNYKDGTVPSDLSTASSAQQSVSMPIGIRWTITYTGNTGYNGGAQKTDYKTAASAYTETHNTASLKYFTLSCGATTYQTYSVSFTANSTYGGTLPSNVSGQSAAKDFSCPYGATATVTYAALSQTAQYSYSGATATRTYTMTSAQTCAAASATRTVRQYKVILSGDYATKNVRITNSSGAVVSSGSSYDYGTVIYINGSLPSNTAQYTYSSLSLKWGSTAVSAGATQTLTGDVTVTVTCTRTTNQYTVTITGNATKNVRLTNSSGSAISSGSKYNYGTVIYINGSLPSNTAQYTYSSLSLKWGGTAVSAGATQTLTGNVTIDVSCTVTTNQYTVTLAGDYATRNVRVTNSSGAVVSSGSKYNYGTVIYIAGSLPSNTAQYAYSGLSLKWGSTAVSSGSTQTLTGNVTITISCTRSTQKYTVTMGSHPNCSVSLACSGLSTVTNANLTNVPYGSTVTATATPNSGYNINSISFS